MVTIKCDECEGRFAVEDKYIVGGKVNYDFECPYCFYYYEIGDRVKVRPLVDGGVNITGNADISGDVTGGDSIKVNIGR